MGFPRFSVLVTTHQKGSPPTRYHDGQTGVVSLILHDHLLAAHGRLNP
ncbi:BgTH12-01441 [Blumeria graminis f. sp. triticale]|uniref:BgTH12-01441 n=1 Tax=Blumeria graminis f. sp. triticale TaxID=1689686 RepID=A0A9W4GD50_BLUGR|nr:BgTH12-01441 [Blumeria graminis f. sp. triticale]